MAIDRCREWALCKGEMSAEVTKDGGLVTGEVAALVFASEAADRI